MKKKREGKRAGKREYLECSISLINNRYPMECMLPYMQYAKAETSVRLENTIAVNVMGTEVITATKGGLLARQSRKGKENLGLIASF